MERILETIVKGSSEEGLIHAEKAQMVLVSRSPHINHVPLEKTASSQDSGWLVCSLVQTVCDIASLSEAGRMILVGVFHSEFWVPSALASREQQHIV
jgi:hypothetical protein